MMHIKKLLSEHFCEFYDIKDGPYTIEMIDARNLIVPERLDLIAKYKYIEHREKGLNLSYAKDLYIAHIEAFSSGTFIEPGQEKTKNSASAYLRVFDGLIDSVKAGGFDSAVSVVPVGRGNIILDGSHRTAIAAYYNIPLPIIRFDHLATPNYGASFFAGNFLTPDYLDYMVSVYCSLKKNVYMGMLWPRAFTKIDSNGTIDVIIHNYCKIVFKKELRLAFNGLASLMTQVYHQEEWLGNAKNGFAGANSKALECYDKNEKITVYILESDDAKAVLDLKQKIRDITGIANSAIHTTDSAAETVLLCKTLLNKNSLHLLNYGVPGNLKKAHEKFDLFKQRLLEHNLDIEEFIIDSSGVLGLYGLRDIEDIDFLSVSKKCENMEDDTIRNHHEYLKYYGKTLDELIFDPTNYLYYNNTKFITLEAIRIMKKNRDEPKDIRDVALIDSFLQKHYSKKQAIIHFIRKIEPPLIRKWRNFRDAAIKCAIKLLKITRTYTLVRGLYRKIKRPPQDTI